MHRIHCFRAGIASLLVLYTTHALAAPQVFNTPFHQSPVRGDPNDLLVIGGSDFQAQTCIIYERFVGSTPPPTPSGLPAANTAASGRIVAPDTAINNVPPALSVRLPAVMAPREQYAIYIQNAGGCSTTLPFSEPVVINDPLPRWFSPSIAYATADLGNLGRRLRVVGRNLWPRPYSAAIRRIVRLVGPDTYTMTAPAASLTLDEYVVDVSLPENMKAGNYTVQISFDGGTNWSTVPDQTFRVYKDPEAKPIFPVSSYKRGAKACEPDDGQDDTWCIHRAIEDAYDAPRKHMAMRFA